MAFAGAYKTHGLYAYNPGKYKGEAYFGRGSGSRTTCALAGQYRPQAVMSEAQAAQVAKVLGFKVGGGMAFGGAYKTHGLYAYNSGKYKGEAYFGRGGKGIGACALAGQFRPQY